MFCSSEGFGTIQSFALQSIFDLRAREFLWTVRDRIHIILNALDGATNCTFALEAHVEALHTALEFRMLKVNASKPGWWRIPFAEVWHERWRHLRHGFESHLWAPCGTALPDSLFLSVLHYFNLHQEYLQLLHLRSLQRDPLLHFAVADLLGADPSAFAAVFRTLFAERASVLLLSVLSCHLRGVAPGHLLAGRWDSSTQWADIIHQAARVSLSFLRGEKPNGDREKVFAVAGRLDACSWSHSASSDPEACQVIAAQTLLHLVQCPQWAISLALLDDVRQACTGLAAAPHVQELVDLLARFEAECPAPPSTPIEAAAAARESTASGNHPLLDHPAPADGAAQPISCIAELLATAPVVDASSWELSGGDPNVLRLALATPVRTYQLQREFRPHLRADGTLDEVGYLLEHVRLSNPLALSALLAPERSPRLLSSPHCLRLLAHTVPSHFADDAWLPLATKCVGSVLCAADGPKDSAWAAHTTVLWVASGRPRWGCPVPVEEESLVATPQNSLLLGYLHRLFTAFGSLPDFEAAAWAGMPESSQEEYAEQMVRFFNLLTADAIQEGDFAINASFLFWQAPRRFLEALCKAVQGNLFSSVFMAILERLPFLKELTSGETTLLTEVVSEHCTSGQLPAPLVGQLLRHGSVDSRRCIAALCGAPAIVTAEVPAVKFFLDVLTEMVQVTAAGNATTPSSALGAKPNGSFPATVDAPCVWRVLRLTLQLHDRRLALPRASVEQLVTVVRGVVQAAAQHPTFSSTIERDHVLQFGHLSRCHLQQMWAKQAVDSDSAAPVGPGQSPADRLAESCRLLLEATVHPTGGWVQRFICNLGPPTGSGDQPPPKRLRLEDGGGHTTSSWQGGAPLLTAGLLFLLPALTEQELTTLVLEGLPRLFKALGATKDMEFHVVSLLLRLLAWHWQGAACPLTAHLLRRLRHAGPFGDIQPAAAPDSSANRTAAPAPRAGLARPILAALQALCSRSPPPRHRTLCATAFHHLACLLPTATEADEVEQTCLFMSLLLRQALGAPGGQDGPDPTSVVSSDSQQSSPASIGGYLSGAVQRLAERCAVARPGLPALALAPTYCEAFARQIAAAAPP